MTNSLKTLMMKLIHPTLLLLIPILVFGCSKPGPPAAEAPAPMDERKPNVILIMADDLGYETLGTYGSASYNTPVLDRLAETGVRFDNAHAQPLCTPTRVSLMTGKYNWRNWHSFGIMRPDAKTFGHWMTAAGYRTCISGKWQLQSYNPHNFCQSIGDRDNAWKTQASTNIFSGTTRTPR